MLLSLFEVERAVMEMIMVFGFLVSFGFGQYYSERGERVPLPPYIAVHFSTEERACTFLAVLHFHFITLFVTAVYDCISQTLGKSTRFHRGENKVLLLLLLLLHSGAAFHHFINVQQVTKAAVFHGSVW